MAQNTAVWNVDSNQQCVSTSPVTSSVEQMRQQPVKDTLIWPTLTERGQEVFSPSRVQGRLNLQFFNINISRMMSGKFFRFLFLFGFFSLLFVFVS